MSSSVVPLMPWRSKQARPASTIAARVRAASSLVLLMWPFTYVPERMYSSALFPPLSSLPMILSDSPVDGIARHLVLAAALAVLAGCGKADGSAQPAAEAPPLQVATVKAVTKAVPVSLEAVGQAEGSREVEIRGRVTGILEKRLYEE